MEINIRCCTPRNQKRTSLGYVTGTATKIETKYVRSRFGRSNGYQRYVTFVPDDGSRVLVKPEFCFVSIDRTANRIFDNI